MIRKLLISVLMIFVTFQISVSQQLTGFDYTKTDSIAYCKLLEKYESYQRYLLNLMDTTSVDNLSTIVALNQLLLEGTRDITTHEYKNKFNISDRSLTGNNSNYFIREYTNQIIDAKRHRYVYQKGVDAVSAPDIETWNPKNVDGWFVPSSIFSIPFLETTIKSGSIASSLRSSAKISFIQYMMKKQLNGNLYKQIDYEEFAMYETEYKKYYNEKSIGVPNQDIPEQVTRYQLVLDSLFILEQEFTSNVIKFRNITEKEVNDRKSLLKEYNTKLNECNCKNEITIVDEDGDGYSVHVDCDDNDSTVYPGATINCKNKNKDDNCDGFEDKCCIDEDGDGFYRAEGCDCSEDLSSIDILNKCDCNDDPNNGGTSIYPGADINCDNGYNDDNCDGIIDVGQVQVGQEINLRFIDNIYPPYGLTNFAKDKRFYIYSGLMLAGIGSSIYHKVQSNRYYSRYEDAETFRIQGNNYLKANNNHKRFVVSAAFTAGVYLTSFIDLRIRYAKYNNIRNEINQRNAGCALIYDIELNPIDLTSVGVGPSLKMRF